MNDDTLSPPPPPAPPAEEPKVETASKRSEAVFIASHMVNLPDGWTREVTYFYEGDEYQYGLQAFAARTEEEGKRITHSQKANKELHSVFLRDVRLDMTRPH